MTDQPPSQPKIRSYPRTNAIYYFDEDYLREMMEEYGQPHEGLTKEEMLRILEPLVMPDHVLDYWEKAQKEFDEMAASYLAKQKEAKSSARSRSTKKPAKP